ncbi:MAG: alpha/beta hydrolase [Clostridia bacterium]|nr:alpha/beta hydrolase [Clostridia bacterium]
MRLEKRNLYDEGEYDHIGTYGFCPNIVPYIHEDDVERPAVLVVPGGAYRFCSPTEGEPVALNFYDRGFQTFVVTYTTNPLDMSPVGKQALNDLARAVRLIRHYAAEYHVRKDMIAICGFSAGGHATASLCVHFREVTEPNGTYADESPRPDLSILAYPVITSDPSYTHLESMELLLGNDMTDEQLQFTANEKNVSEETPPAFIWHTFDDNTVPPRNSIEYAKALNEKGVPVSLHVFTKGMHGLATADGKSAVTMDNSYTYEPLVILMEALKKGLIRPGGLKDPVKDIGKLERQLLRREYDEAVREPEAEVWTELAEKWMKSMFKK